MKLLVSADAVQAINAANRPNHIQVICDSSVGWIIDDNRDDPLWSDWWDKYTQAGGLTLTTVEVLADND